MNKKDIEILNEYINTLSDISSRKHRDIIADCKKIEQYLKVYNKTLIDMLNPVVIKDFINIQKLTYSIFTVDRRLSTLRNILIWAKDNNKISKDINIFIPEISSNVKRHSMCADKKYINILYKYCTINDTDDYRTARGKFMMLCVIVCGFKTNFIKNMKVSDLNSESENIMIRLLIQRESRNVEKYLNKLKLKLSDNGITKNDSLFINNYGSKYSDICEDFRHIRYLCGVPATVTFNSIRNTCIKEFKSELSNDIIMCKLFDITEDRLNKL